MRKIDLLVVHCSDSDYEHHDNYFSIKQWHVVENGWSDVGYHFLILKSGEIVKCRPVERPGAHCAGFNENSIGICLTGKESFSKEQFRALNELISELQERYKLTVYDILGHKELDEGKTCPNFNVIEKIIGIILK
jgi:N-acetyl-anhydromuramyl-L-alanine amidase AmpD